MSELQRAKINSRTSSSEERKQEKHKKVILRRDVVMKTM